MTPIAGDIINNVFDLFKGWIKTKYPDPIEQKKAENEFKQYMDGKEHAEVQQFMDFVVEYEGAGKDVSPWLQNYRGSVRPTITYVLVGAFIWGIMDGWSETLMDLVYRLNLISMSFWYGERAMKNLGLDLSGAFKKK